jgi:hypothetical protein
MGGHFNTSLSPIDRPSRQKINKETVGLKDTIDQMNLTDIYSVLHPAAAQNIFFLANSRTFSKTPC